MQRLTDTQIYTLRRMEGGIEYRVRGDGKKGQELRTRYVNTGTGIECRCDDINAPSIPVLLRLGLVKLLWKGSTESTKWYEVTRTYEGVAATWQPVSIEVGK